MIGIFGGTFDPIHYGHLRPTQEIKQALSLKSLFLVPVAIPPHRNAPLATAAQRLHMVNIAIEDFTELSVDDCEIKRGGISYTVDTLRYFRERYPRMPLCLLLGGDAFVSFQTWHQWESIPNLVHITVMQRPHHEFEIPQWCEARLTQNIEELSKSVAGKVYLHKVAPVDISATVIRQAIKSDEDISSMLPNPVQHYIETHQIYE